MPDGPQQPVDLDPVEQLADAPGATCDSSTDRGRRAVIRAQQELLRQRLAAAVRRLPPGGTLHA